jgi:hypothetical protein
MGGVQCAAGLLRKYRLHYGTSWIKLQPVLKEDRFGYQAKYDQA